MSIFSVLKTENLKIRRLLDDLIDNTVDPDDFRNSDDVGAQKTWQELLQELKIALISLHRAEEAVVFEALRDIPHRAETADSETEEDLRAEELLRELEKLTPEDASWVTQINLLKSQIEQQISDVESSVFNLLQTKWSDDDSEESLQMASDFQTSLDGFRKEVLSGSEARLTE